MADFKTLAIKQNGTSLVEGGLQQVDPNAAAAPTTVNVVAGGDAAATAPPSAASPPPGQVVQGSGTDGQGQACTCQCLCGVASFPANAAVNNFGGFAGMIG